MPLGSSAPAEPESIATGSSKPGSIITVKIQPSCPVGTCIPRWHWHVSSKDHWNTHSVAPSLEEALEQVSEVVLGIRAEEESWRRHPCP